MVRYDHLTPTLHHGQPGDDVGSRETTWAALGVGGHPGALLGILEHWWRRGESRGVAGMDVVLPGWMWRHWDRHGELGRAVKKIGVCILLKIRQDLAGNPLII